MSDNESIVVVNATDADEGIFGYISYSLIGEDCKTYNIGKFYINTISEYHFLHMYLRMTLISEIAEFLASN